MSILLRSVNRIRASGHLFAKSRVCSISKVSQNTSKYTFYNNSDLNPLKNPSSIHLFTKNLSSQTGTNSSDKSDSELEGFSDLDKSPDEESNSDLNLNYINLKLEKRFTKGRLDFPLFKLLLETSSYSLKGSLDNWIKKGNDLERGVVFVALFHLRKLKLFNKALQFMEWLEQSEQYKFTDRDYTTLLDLIAKVHGPNIAENFLSKMPQIMRTEVTYRTLLANYVLSSNVLKSEQIFNKMRELGFPLTTFACNQLLLLYRRIDKKKISDVLLMMERENLKPSLFTFKILIDVKGSIRDITGLEQLLDTMKLEGIEPDILIKSQVCKYYILAGFNEKGEKLLREIEGSDLSKNRPACKHLMPLYADLGKVDDVNRVWNICKLNPLKDEVINVINAFGKLGLVESAEKVFDEMTEKFEKVSRHYYEGLIRVYANKRLLDKVEKFGDVINEKGIQIGGVTLDCIVKMYVELGDLNKAELILNNWMKNNKNNQVIKPLYGSYLSILEEYAKKGDYHNAERIFYEINKVGYFGRIKRYELLIKAYINAKVPVYGFRERMKADNLFPNSFMNQLLVKADPFREKNEFDLLD